MFLSSLLSQEVMLPALRVDPAYFIYFGKDTWRTIFLCNIYCIGKQGALILVTLRFLIYFSGLFVFVGVFFLTAILLAIVVDSYW